MNQKHIVKFERGTLYLKLRETFDTSRMEIHATLAEITRNGVQVVKADSKGEISSTCMNLTSEEFAILVEGHEMIRKFWDSSPLPYQYVQLGCGCVQSWAQDELPRLDNWGWCEDHEEQTIYRFNATDFTREVVEEATQPA